MNELRNPLLGHFHYPEAKSLRLRMMELVLIHKGNAAESIVVTLDGMAIEASLSQSENAESPMVVTPNGMMIDVRLLHPMYLEVTDYQLFVANTEEKRIGFYV